MGFQTNTKEEAAGIGSSNKSSKETKKPKPKKKPMVKGSAVSTKDTPLQAKTGVLTSKAKDDSSSSNNSKAHKKSKAKNASVGNDPSNVQGSADMEKGTDPLLKMTGTQTSINAKSDDSLNVSQKGSKKGKSAKNKPMGKPPGIVPGLVINKKRKGKRKGPQPKTGDKQTIKAKASDNSSKAIKRPKAKEKSKVKNPTSAQRSGIAKKHKEAKGKVHSKAKAEPNDDFFDKRNHIFAFYHKLSEENKYNSIKKWYIPYINFEFSFNGSQSSKDNGAKAHHSRANREKRRKFCAYMSQTNRSGYLAKKRKKAGTQKAARKEQFLSNPSMPSIVLSNHAIQRYRERGLNTFPIIKKGDRNNSSAVVATFLPKLPSLQHFKTTRNELLPFMQHPSLKHFPTRKGKAPKEIESIFAYSNNAVKKIEIERRRMRRRGKAYKRT